MKLTIAIALIILLMGLVGRGDYQDAEIAHDYYCDMVSKWALSGGEYGHPNYNNRDCKQ